MGQEFKKDEGDKPFLLAWDTGYSWDMGLLALKPGKF